MTTKPLIFTDLDGTLLDHHTYKATDAFEMLSKLKEKNIPVVANTSKTKEEVETLQTQLTLNGPFIVENGAAVYIPKGYFSAQPLGTVDDGKYWLKTFTPAREHWQTLLSSNAQEFQHCFTSFSQMLVHELAQLTDLSLGAAAMAKNRQYSEPLHWQSDEETKKQFIAHMKTLGANILQGGRFIHVSGVCDKGQALQWLAQRYTEDLMKKSSAHSLVTTTIALGDSGNDSAMLEAADIAVQIKSPIQAFPKLLRKENLHQSTLYGPKGWSECLDQILVDNSY